MLLSLRCIQCAALRAVIVEHGVDTLIAEVGPYHGVTILARTIERAKDAGVDDSKTNMTKLVFISPQQMRVKYRRWRARYGAMWCATQNAQRSLQQLQRYRRMSERFMELLASNKIPRLKQLVSRKLREGRSLSSVVDAVTKAVSGEYNPKGFDDEDIDDAMAVLRLGGQWYPRARSIHCFDRRIVPPPCRWAKCVCIPPRPKVAVCNPKSGGLAKQKRRAAERQGPAVHRQPHGSRVVDHA